MPTNHTRIGWGRAPAGASRPSPAVLALALLAFGCAPAEPPDDADPAAGQTAGEETLGSVDFPTSCGADVQPVLEQGVALLHHMMYDDAERAFRAVAESEEDCAMAHWGIAMSRFQPFWGSADVPAGREAAERAVALEAPTERERAYARAALAFFEGEDVRYAERVRAWEEAMAELHEAFPDDREAAAFYALAHLSVAPGDPAHQERAASIVRAIHEEEPEHPGAVHYAIHVHDVEARADEGVHFARAYEDIAPSIPHALHMPSHIYVRLGGWDEVIDWNRRSADAALEHPAGEQISLHYPHAMDYLMYGYLQKGEDERARAVLEEIRSRENFQPHLATAYALAAIPARWHVERRDWAGAAELEVGVPEGFPWDRFPGAEAMSHFARGLGAVRSGAPDEARASLERLEALETAATEADDSYWARQIRVQKESLAAWIAFAEGRADEAVRLMTAAAELSGRMEKHPVTPGDLQPAYELLGDLLLELDRPGEALAAYERSLDTWPRRYHSLLGAARAAERAGQTADAARYYRELAELAEDASEDREGVAEARRWLEAA